MSTFQLLNAQPNVARYFGSLRHVISNPQPANGRPSPRPPTTGCAQTTGKGWVCFNPPLLVRLGRGTLSCRWPPSKSSLSPGARDVSPAPPVPHPTGAVAHRGLAEAPAALRCGSGGPGGVLRPPGVGDAAGRGRRGAAAGVLRREVQDAGRDGRDCRRLCRLPARPLPAPCAASAYASLMISMSKMAKKYQILMCLFSWHFHLKNLVKNPT